MTPLQARYPEAFEYLRARGVEPSADFYDRVEAARRQAWTMSKLSNLDHIQRIKDSLEKAIAEGTSFDNWRKENLADLQGLPKSYQETVFRTAVQSSYNAGRWAHFRDHAERRPILRYTAINDSRTRPAHRALHGLMMPVDDPRWQTLAPPGGFNCFLPGTKVQGTFELGLKSFYTGEAVEITTGTGQCLAVTANHPVLTGRGWLPAHQVKEGDNLLADGGEIQPLPSPILNNQHAPTRVEDVFESLGTDGTGILDIAAFQFHNDTHLRKSEVHVAGADAHLLYRVQTKRRQRIQKICFIDADRIAVNRRAAAYSSTHRRITRQVELLDNTVDIAIRAASNLCDLAAATILGVKIQLDNLFCAFARSGLSPRPSGCTLTFNPARGSFDGAPFALLGFPPTARRDAVCQQPLADNVTADPVAFGQSVFTLPIEIVNDDGVYHVIRDMGTHFRETAALAIRKFHYSGHVYDFQTENGIIAANGIITHNCRCTLMSLSERQAKGMGYTGTPQDIPTWTDKHGVEHTAAPDKGWNHSPEHDLTDLLREREQKAGVAPAQYSEPEAIKPTLPPPEQWREVAKAGEEIWAKHTDLLNAVDHTKAGDFSRAILEIMEREGVQTGAEVKANGDTVANFQKIINRYPASWVERANEAGTVYIRNLASRGFQTYLDEEMAGYVNKLGKYDADFKPFTKLAEQFQVGDSLLKLNNMAGKELSEKAQDIAIHEFGHRLQYTIPGLDDYFKQLWLDRTAGEKTRPLRDIQKERGEEPYFHRDEKGRKDAFADAYIGKNYGTDDEPQPFEVLAMVFQILLGSGKSRGLTPQGLLERDPEMLYLGLGLLTRFTP